MTEEIGSRRTETIHVAKDSSQYEGLIIKEKGKLGANAIKRVAGGAHLPTPWLFEPAKRPDDRAD